MLFTSVLDKFLSGKLCAGINVAMACPDNNGQMTTWGEETTNWLGNFVMKFDGNPDLSGCVAQVYKSSSFFFSIDELIS